MKKFLKTIILSVSPLFILGSCSSDDEVLDITKPVITLLSPKDHAHLHLGDTFTVEAILKDDIELGSGKIDIHYSGDGHQHRSINTEWKYSKEIQISSGKKEEILSHQITIPKEGILDGSYHLGVFLIDKAGNQTQTFIEIDIVNHGNEHDH